MRPLNGRSAVSFHAWRRFFRYHFNRALDNVSSLGKLEPVVQMTNDERLNPAQEALNRGDWKTALSNLPRHYEAFTDSAILKHLCCAYLQAERWEEVILISASAAQRFSNEAIFWECWAWAEHKQSHSVTALRILEFVSRRFAKRENIAFSLACLYAANNRLTEAKSWLARAKKLASDRAAFNSRIAAQRELRVLWTSHERAFAT